MHSCTVFCYILTSLGVTIEVTRDIFQPPASGVLQSLHFILMHHHLPILEVGGGGDGWEGGGGGDDLPGEGDTCH